MSALFTTSHARPDVRSYVLGILAIAAIYFATAELALRLHELGAVSSLVWVPSGIGFAFILLYGQHWWPGVALGTFVSVLIRHHPVAAAVATTTEVLEVIVGYQLLHNVVRFRPQLDRVRDVVGFVAVDIGAALMGATIGASIVVAADFAAREHFVQVWSTWWWVNLCGDLIVTPALLTWLAHTPLPRRPRTLEVGALVISGLIVGALVLTSQLPTWLPGSRSPYYLLPIMLWAGVRFGPRGAATASLTASLAAIVTDALGIGTFAARMDLQAFVAISSVTTLVVSALAEERVRAVQRRGAIQLAALDAIITIDGLGRILELNPAAEHLFALRAADVIGKDAAMLVIPERLRSTFYRGLRHYAQTGRSSLVGTRYRASAWRASDDREFPVEVAVTRVPDDDHVILTAFIRDISAEYAAESARREANASLERKVSERTAELRESLREGDMLLREIHHRVKNNLQVISSLLHLQLATARDDTTRKVLVESQNRIAAMALVHQQLYRSKEVARIDFGEYLRELAARLFAAYTVPSDQVTIEVDAAAVQVDLDRAIPCGLIVNELVANALDHAFPHGRKGHVRITLARRGDLLELDVADDGIGLPATTRVDAPTTFGLSIVRALAAQMDGTIAVVPSPGTTMRLTFPANE